MTNNNTVSTYEETFFIVPRKILKLEGLTFTFLKLYETIFQFWNKDTPCYLSNETIKKRTGIKSDATINDAFMFFESAGEIKRVFVEGKRFLTQPRKQIEIEQILPCPEKPDTENQETYKTKKTKKTQNKDSRFKYKRAGEDEQNSSSENKTNPSKEKPKQIQSLPPEKKQGEDMAIDLNFQYQEVYYMQDKSISNQLVKHQNNRQELTTGSPQGFQMFWDMYPRQSNKIRSQAIWLAQGCEEIAEEIIEKLKVQIKKDQRFLDGYVKNADNYLLNESWNDKIFSTCRKNGNRNFNNDDTSWADSDRRTPFE